MVSVLSDGTTFDCTLSVGWLIKIGASFFTSFSCSLPMKFLKWLAAVPTLKNRFLISCLFHCQIGFFTSIVLGKSKMCGIFKHTTVT